MDDDLLRNLDWEPEAAEDDDVVALLREALRRGRAGEVEQGLETVERALLQPEAQFVANDTAAAMLLLLRVVFLGELERLDEALLVCPRMLEITHDGDGEMRLLDGYGRTRYSLLLFERGEGGEASERLAQIVRDFAHDDDPRARKVAVGAQGYRIRVLLELNRVDDATTEWRALLDASKANTEADVEATVALAGTNAALAALSSRKRSLALALADDVIRHFGSARDADTRAAVAVAMSCRVRSLLRRGRIRAGLRANGDLLRFVGREPEREVVDALRSAWPKNAARLLRAARLQVD